MKIVGIGGLPRSGKDTLAELFVEADYYGVSLGDISRRHSRERHADKDDPISVANMTETSNWLRETYGAEIILKEALEEFEEASKNATFKGVVLFSVRASIEVDFILGHKGRLIWVETSDEVRHHRAMQNLREGEQPISPEEFKRQEDLQWQPQPGIPAEAQMNVAYVKEKATDVLENNGDDRTAFLDAGRLLIQDISNS